MHYKKYHRYSLTSSKNSKTRNEAVIVVIAVNRYYERIVIVVGVSDGGQKIVARPVLSI